MSLAVAVQMDPIHLINIDADSTFVLALEAQKRGHGLYYYEPKDLSFHHGRIVARVYPMKLRREKGNHFELDDPRDIDLATVDVVLMRQDPPFDMGYITATHLLEHIHPRTLVVNDPVSVRNAPEKLFVTRFPDLMPPTLISGDVRRINEFRAEHQDIIVKPLFGNGGLGVFHLGPKDENLGAVLELFRAIAPREPVMVQRYIPAVRQGDKRIILVDGEPVGAVNRVPPEGEARANMHVGGRPEKSSLSQRDQEICRSIGPVLKDMGLIFVGIDVIGGFLTEINVTSPTGIQEINRFDQTHIEAKVWDAIEKRLKSRRTQ